MWTVTLLLKPLIVVAHLFGGLATLACCVARALARATLPSASDVRGCARSASPAVAALALQIFLGGWTSTNYAALACPDFPTCQTQWWPAIADFKDGFVLWRGLGIDYEGGVLDHPARVAMHFTHRLGAVARRAADRAAVVRLARHASTRADAGLAVLAALAAAAARSVLVSSCSRSRCPSRSRTTASRRCCCSRCSNANPRISAKLTLRRRTALARLLRAHKPRVVQLIVFTAIVGMFLAAPGMAALDALIFGSLGIGLAASRAAPWSTTCSIAASTRRWRAPDRPLPTGR